MEIIVMKRIILINLPWLEHHIPIFYDVKDVHFEKVWKDFTGKWRSASLPLDEVVGRIDVAIMRVNLSIKKLRRKRTEAETEILTFLYQKLAKEFPKTEVLSLFHGKERFSQQSIRINQRDYPIHMFGGGESLLYSLDGLLARTFPKIFLKW